MGAREVWSPSYPTTADTQRTLLVKLVIAETGGGGGGGGTEQEVYPGHYGGVTPGIVPLVAHAMAYDLDAPYATWKWNPDTSAWE